MNLLMTLIDFYSNLSSDGLFFFWIIIFLLGFLIFLTIVLVLKNRKLVNLLEEERNTYSNSSDEVIIKEDNVEVPITEEVIVETEKEEEPIVEIKEETVINPEKPVKEETGLYKKNVLREMNSRGQTSPIRIEKREEIVQQNNYDNYDFDEVYLRDDSVSPLESMEDAYEVNDNMKFASEIVDRMEEEIRPSNIELNDYEKKQEEEAIISYDELLKVKDKIYNITEDEETDEFIDELKSFRLDL